MFLAFFNHIEQSIIIIDQFTVFSTAVIFFVQQIGSVSLDRTICQNLCMIEKKTITFDSVPQLLQSFPAVERTLHIFAVKRFNYKTYRHGSFLQGSCISFSSLRRQQKAKGLIGDSRTAVVFSQSGHITSCLFGCLQSITVDTHAASICDVGHEFRFGNIAVAGSVRIAANIIIVDGFQTRQLNCTGINSHQMARSMIQADRNCTGNLIEPFAVDVFQLGITQNQRIDTKCIQPMFIIIVVCILGKYIAQLGDDFICCFAAFGNFAVSSMPVKVADISIVHIIKTT